jgi:uncharacterized protein YyaL (SSP411 family)
MALLTLEKMASGGIYDHVGGGFHRYSTDERWRVPHFEKMLYDNALLARAYLHGHQALGHERWRIVCERTLDWMLVEMWDREDGGFYSAYDADSEGVEGKFYVWTPAEIREVLGDGADGVIDHYGVTEEGNFEGTNILNLIDRPRAEPPPGLDEARRKLYAARAERVWPGLDDKRVMSWNALAIAALADAGAVLGSDRYLDAAREAADFVWTRMRDPEGRLLRTFNRGEAKIDAFLEDYAFLLEALLVLYEATFEVRWFDAARETADAMIDRFADPERGGFFTTSADHEQLIARRKDIDDHPIPSGNSSAAYGLLRLAALTGEHEYERHAVSVFRLLHGAATRHPHGLAHLLRAMDFHFAAVKEVALVAPASAGAQATDGAADAVAAQGTADAIAPLAAAVRSGFRPYLVLAGGPEGTDRPELMRERSAVQGKSAAYVCENFACRRPVTEPEELAAAL